jgi:hypothetical protein
MHQCGGAISSEQCPVRQNGHSLRARSNTQRRRSIPSESQLIGKKSGLMPMRGFSLRRSFECSKPD